jgi:sugar phosphate isomerase/epimerase
MTDRTIIEVNMDRRQFLGAMATGVVLSPHLGCGRADDRPSEAPTAGATPPPSRRIERIGVQLYTVRTEMEKDVEATLARIAQIGFKEVEFAGYFNRTPKDIRAMLDRNGLTAPAAHVPYASLGAGWKKVLDDSVVVGHEYLVIPFLDDEVRAQPDAYARVAEALNKGAEETNKAGLKFAYHNHQFEFVPAANGQSGWDTLVTQCSPSVLFELDLFWASVAGQDPIRLFEAHPGRFPLVHVKDMETRPDTPAAEMVPFERAFEELADVGEGSIDWAAIFARGDLGGIRHYFVEHDQPKAPFESIEASYRYLTKLRF